MADTLTHESLYRGEKIIAARARKNIRLFGAGALGSRLLDLLASQGYSGLSVVDFDIVDRHNLGNQNYSPQDIGKKKAVQASNNIYRRLGVKVDGIDKRVTADNVDKLVKGMDLVVDVFDNATSRQLLIDACKRNGVECLHCGLSADGFAELEWNENYHAYDSPQDGAKAPCEYPLAVNLVVFAVGLCAEVINQFVDLGQKKSVHFTLKDMHVHIVKA